MNPIHDHLLVADRTAALRAEAAAERLARDARRSRGHPADEADLPVDGTGRRLRGPIGRALIGLGAAIAAVPRPEGNATDRGIGRPA